MKQEPTSLAIEAALGTEILAKTVNCQWHFWQSAKNHLKDINEHERETFRVMDNELCFASTANTYNKIASTMKNICECSNIINWWNWWDARKFHILPAFRGFNLPGLNLAETGNSMIKCHKPMSLAVAAW